MTKTTIRFNLKAVRGSEFDLWQPVDGGPSKVRPLSVKESYWPGHRTDSTKLEEFAVSLWKEFGLPIEPGSWTEIDLDLPKLPELVARLTGLKKANLVKPVNGEVEIKLVDTPEEPCEWFELSPKNDSSHIEIEATTCKADKAKPGVHVTPHFDCVDEKFKAVVEKNGFTGLDFLWLLDEGRYAAPQWFLAIALNPIGRGIDHEFFDNTKIRGDGFNQPTEPESRIGVTCFYGDQLKSPAPFQDRFQNELLSLFSDEEYSTPFRTYRQFLSAYLPETDFAFAWETKNSPILCFNRKVRDALVTARILSSDECKPIKIWKDIPSGAQRLDGICPKFPSGRFRFLDEIFIQIKQESEKAWAWHLANPKPKRQAKMPQALKLLREAKKVHPSFFLPKPNVADVEIAAGKLGNQFPKKWQEVLRLTDSFEMSLDESDSFEVEPANNLEEHTKSIQDGWFADKAEYHGRFLHITSGAGGDFHSLDLSTCTPDGDCRVLQFSHETLQPEREWESIAEFVQEIAETMLAETDDD